MLDVISIIYTKGEYDEDGNVITPPQPKDGYHVNVAFLPDSLAQFEIVPVTPHRVFGGHTTYCLKFTDRNEWLAQGIEYTDEEGERAFDMSSLKARKQLENWRQSTAVRPLRLHRALRDMGEMPTVRKYIEKASEETQEAWEKTTIIPRLDSLVIGIQRTLGRTDAEVDQLFELALTKG